MSRRKVDPWRGLSVLLGIAVSGFMMPQARADWLATVVAQEEARYAQQYGKRAIPVTAAAANASNTVTPVPLPLPVTVARQAELPAGEEDREQDQSRRRARHAGPFAELIRHHARKNQLPTRLVAAVIRAESGFRPRITSPKGAMGLMQLMPATAKRFGVKNAYDPAQNIAGGTRYLAWLLKHFDDDVRLALAGYNAGEGAVERYGRKIPPYRETRTYVKRVLRFYREQ